MIYNSPVLPFLAARALPSDASLRRSGFGPSSFTLSAESFRNHWVYSSNSSAIGLTCIRRIDDRFHTLNARLSVFDFARFHSLIQSKERDESSLFHSLIPTQFREPGGFAIDRSFSTFGESRKGGVHS